VVPAAEVPGAGAFADPEGAGRSLQDAKRTLPPSAASPDGRELARQRVADAGDRPGPRRGEIADDGLEAAGRVEAGEDDPEPKRRGVERQVGLAAHPAGELHRSRRRAVLRHTSPFWSW